MVNAGMFYTLISMLLVLDKALAYLAKVSSSPSTEQGTFALVLGIKLIACFLLIDDAC